VTAAAASSLLDARADRPQCEGRLKANMLQAMTRRVRYPGSGARERACDAGRFSDSKQTEMY
jgi:hypothetical protein